jgi:hypothetical protein
MASRLRTVAWVLLTLAVWLVVKPAAAAAPLCDKRAATGFAPPPTLDIPVASVDVGDNTDSCSMLGVDRDTTYNEGRRSDPWPAPSRTDVTVDGDGPAVAPPDAVVVRAPETYLVHRTGVRARLERPPRT